MNSSVRVCCLPSQRLGQQRFSQTAKPSIRGIIQRQTRVLAEVPCRGIEVLCHGAECVLKAILKVDMRVLELSGASRAEEFVRRTQTVKLLAAHQCKAQPERTDRASVALRAEAVVSTAV